MADYAFFAIAFFASAIAPGADTTLVLSRALESQRKAWLAGAGIGLAKVVLLVVAFLGASTLISENPTLMITVKILGATFLCYRALVLWRKTRIGKVPKSSSGLADFGLGFGTAFTNPQPLAFYLAIVPQVAANTDLVVLASIVAVGFAIVTWVYATLAKPISRALESRGPAFINRVVAILLLLVAGWILLR